MIKKKINIFLTSIEQNENKIFENNFVINQNKNLKKYVWGFSNSDKNLKIWENMNKGDWILFYFNSRYSYVGRIFKKQKSNLIAKKVFGNELQNKNLII